MEKPKRNPSKLLFGLALAFGFMALGVYLAGSQNTLVRMLGYANIIFFSGLILFAFYKLAFKK